MGSRNPNDDESDRKRIEDNPFISFRRFADEQVSGLLNLSLKVMGVPDSHTTKTEDTEDRMQANKDKEQRNGYTWTVDSGKGGERRTPADTLEEEIDKLDREMTAWLNGEERDESHDQDAVKSSGLRGHWRSRFGSCRSEEERLQDDEDTAWPRWNDHNRRTEAGNQASKAHTWHWSWSYPPRASEDTQSDTQAPIASSNSAAQHPVLGALGEDIWAVIEDGLRRNSRTPAPFPDLGYGLGFTAKMVPFLMSNDYSPLQLESSLRDSDIAWREAFEDLLRAETGQPLLSEKELGETEQTARGIWTSRLHARTLSSCHMRENYRRQFFSWPATGEAVFSRDLERRIPRSRWLSEVEEGDADEHESYEYGHDHEDQHDDPPTPRPDASPSTFARFSEVDDEDGPETELDAYERIVGPTQFTPSHQTNDSASSRPSVLSTLTTTERTTQPDGTVTTKMVLKKRFADGREETSETVHTTQGHNNHAGFEVPSESGAQPKVKQQETPPKQAAEKKTRGWFWS
ncbi:uncharacterized protein BDZ99DRAFT_515206 [Mytilinidion resinicola]|uniref:Uncharacterized protein n=1 Tax=Mytilinidion resinicola TaxID=574789 RepID=A0A6A6Z6A5_9PEZI|nr:uncharacterized protein BDZ99DRAFT_515206 [Mytilinidion resinicola]KAF2816626.1 hypothetical protein BDZ99DRAFT_515206 [Mytilinidion resinicola]